MRIEMGIVAFVYWPKVSLSYCKQKFCQKCFVSTVSISGILEFVYFPQIMFVPPPNVYMVMIIIMRTCASAADRAILRIFSSLQKRRNEERNFRFTLVHARTNGSVEVADGSVDTRDFSTIFLRTIS